MKSFATTVLGLLSLTIISSGYTLPQSWTLEDLEFPPQDLTGSSSEVFEEEGSSHDAVPFIQWAPLLKSAEHLSTISRRSKRSPGNPSAIDLALDHTTTNSNGRTVDRDVLRPFTYSSSSGGGNSLSDFGVNSYRGVGSVVYRSPNRRHTVGVGATSSGSFGRRGGNFYSRPNYGAGVGYTFRF